MSRRGFAVAIAILAIALTILLALGAAPAAADRPYARPARRAHLAAALQAVRELAAADRLALEQALHLGARRRCRADVTAPRVACLVEMAGAHCDGGPPARRAACRAAADIVLTNLRSENEMVDQATRARLVSRGDYRAAMRVELAERQAALAAEMALAEPGPERELPARIDRFCAGRERAMPWQRCAAAIVWYVGGYRPSGGAR